MRSAPARRAPSPAAKMVIKPEALKPSRGSAARAELRTAVEGREQEFLGIAFVLVGVLVGLAIYFHLAGVL